MNFLSLAVAYQFIVLPRALVNTRGVFRESTGSLRARKALAVLLTVPRAIRLVRGNSMMLSEFRR